MRVERLFYRPVALAVLLLSSVIFAGCSSAPKPAEPSQAGATPAVALPTTTSPGSAVAVAHGSGSAPSSAAQSRSESTATSAGGIQWTAPPRWKIGPQRSMRAATYLVPQAGGESEDGECAVFFFGPGQGGSVGANIDRWIGQFEQPDSKPSAPLAKRKKEIINGLSVTSVDLTGTYTGGGPMMGQGGQGSKPGYRLLGAIIEGPQGVVFFKLTGGTKTLAVAQGEFQALLKSLRTA